MGVLEENRLGSIKKGSPKNELPKGDLRGAIAELLGVVSLIGGEPVLLLPNLSRPY